MVTNVAERTAAPVGKTPVYLLVGGKEEFLFTATPEERAEILHHEPHALTTRKHRRHIWERLLIEDLDTAILCSQIPGLRFKLSQFRTRPSTYLERLDGPARWESIDGVHAFRFQGHRCWAFVPPRYPIFTR